MKLKTSTVAICHRFELLRGECEKKKRTQTHNTEFEAKQSQSQNIDEQKKANSEWALTFVYCLHCNFFFLLLVIWVAFCKTFEKDVAK